MNRILITVHGGAVETISADNPDDLKIMVKDLDNGELPEGTENDLTCDPIYPVCEWEADNETAEIDAAEKETVGPWRSR